MLLLVSRVGGCARWPCSYRPGVALGLFQGGWSSLSPQSKHLLANRCWPPRMLATRVGDAHAAAAAVATDDGGVLAGGEAVPAAAGDTPLHAAVRRRHRGAVEALLLRDGDADAAARNAAGETPLHAAASSAPSLSLAAAHDTWFVRALLRVSPGAVNGAWRRSPPPSRPPVLRVAVTCTARGGPSALAPHVCLGLRQGTTCAGGWLGGLCGTGGPRTPPVLAPATWGCRSASLPLLCA
jgi:hypothetical protein